MAVTTYCTSAQALRTLGQVATRIGAATKSVNDAAVVLIIEEVSAEVSGVLREVGYSPGNISGDDDAAAHIRRICLHGVGAELLQRIAAGGSNVDPELARERRLAYEAGLKRLRDGATNLGSLQNFRESGSPVPSSILSGGDDETRPVDYNFKF